MSKGVYNISIQMVEYNLPNVAYNLYGFDNYEECPIFDEMLSPIEVVCYSPKEKKSKKI